MKFTLKNARQFEWKGLRGWTYNSKEDFANASGVYFEVTGSHGKIKITKSDRVYFTSAFDPDCEIKLEEKCPKKHLALT